jgi:hypothetical protein
MPVPIAPPIIPTPHPTIVIQAAAPAATDAEITAVPVAVMPMPARVVVKPNPTSDTPESTL